MAKKVYKLVATFESRSRPGKVYEVKEDEEGNLSCNCPAWIYKANGRRTCRHVEEVRNNGQKESYPFEQKGNR